MDAKQCKDCVNFRQHYAMSHGKIFKVYCGHCTQVRRRIKRPDAVACEYFAPGEADEAAFVTKDYLSKSLLDYVLKMELLPEIEMLSE